LKIAPTPIDESQRLKKLKQYQVIDTESESIFDELTILASQICETKISVISLIDESRQWFKSTVGLDAKETPRDVSFCGHAIMDDEIFEIPDARLDERFTDNPLCVGAPHVIFYAGAPLITPEGYKIGTICVIDDNPKKLSQSQKNILKTLSKQVITLLELKLKKKEITESELLLSRVVQNIPVMLSLYDENGNFLWCNDGWVKELGWTAEEMVRKDMLNQFYPDPKDFQEALEFMMTPDSGWKEFYTRRKDGTYFYTDWSNTRLNNGHTIGIGRNIEDKKRREQELINYQRKIEAIYNSSNDAIMLLDETGFFDCNKKTLELFEIDSVESFTKLHPSDLSPTIQRNGELSKILANQKIQEAYRNGYSRFEWLHQTVGGKVFDAEVMLSRFEFNNQNVLQATVRDTKSRNDLLSQTSNFNAILIKMSSLPANWSYAKKLNEILRLAALALDCERTSFWRFNSSLDLLTSECLYLKSEDTFSSGIVLSQVDYPKYFSEIRKENILVSNDVSNDERLSELRDNYFSSLKIRSMLDQNVRSGEEVLGVLCHESVGENRKWSATEEAFTRSVSDIISLAIKNEELKKKTQDLQNIINALDESAIIAFTDPNGLITYVNKKFEEISGYEASEVIGKTHRMIKSEHHPKEFFEEMWGTISKGLMWKGKIKNKNKSGEHYWVDTIIHPLKDSEGKIEKYLAIRQDITLDKRERAINHLISQLRATFIDFSKQPKSFYQNALRLFLNSTESEFGFIGDVKLDQNNNEYLKTLALTDISWDEQSKKFYEDNKDQGLEFRNLNTLFGHSIKTKNAVISNDPSRDSRAGGTPGLHPKLNSFACFPIFHGNKMLAVVALANRPYGYFANFEKQLKPALDILGEMIESIKLQESLLVQTRISQHNSKLASIGQLAAGVGHEINNPLAIIKGILMLTEEELVERKFLTDSIAKKLNKMDLSIDRIADIVKGLKAFSRSDDGDNVPFSILDLINEVDGLVYEIYSKSGVELNVDVSGIDGIIVSGNRGRIQQVLINLLSNAKDATEDVKNPKITLKCFPKESMVCIQVQDNGKGIPHELKEKVFDPFFTTKEVNKGTGIGLSLVSTIVKEHNGRIDLESEVGKGTLINILLPASETHVQSSRVEDFSKPKEEKKMSHKTSLKALVVDDEDDLRDILSQIVSRLGIEVTQASNGRDAWEIYQKDHFDLVVSDAKMPLMSGLELLEKIRSLSSRKPCKFILISGDINMNQFLEAGPSHCPDDILFKPFKVEIIQSKIKEHLFQIKG
jgi:PAS domain S-box-containing protein